MGYNGWIGFGVFAALLAVSDAVSKQTDLNLAGDHLLVEYVMTIDLASRYPTSELKLTNNYTAAILSGHNWEIPFCSKYRISGVDKTFADGNLLDILHVKGCMHKIVPSQHSGEIFPPSSFRRIKFYLKYSQKFQTDVFPNFYVYANGLKPVTLKSTEDLTNQGTAGATNQNKQEELKFVKLADASKSKVTLTPQERYNSIHPSEYRRTVPLFNVIPPMMRVAPWTVVDGISFSMANSTWNVRGLGQINQPTRTNILDNLKRVPDITAVYDGDNIARVTSNSDGTVVVRIVQPKAFEEFYLSQLPNKNGLHVLEECYEIEIIKTNNLSAGQISIQAGSAKGVINAFNAISGMLGTYSDLPRAKMHNCPRMPVRIFALDSTQNFIPAQEIKRIIGAIAKYNINQFNLKLAGDHAWRIHIKSIPELTGVGSLRCEKESETDCLYHTMGSKVGDHRKYYSAEEFKSILKEADKVGVKVVPEFNFLGSCRSAVIAMRYRYRYYMNKYEKSNKQSDKDEAERYSLRQPNDVKKPNSYDFQDSYFQDGSGVLNPCINSFYNLIEQVLKDMYNMYSQANLQIFKQMDTVNIGGDDTQKVYQNLKTCNYSLPYLQKIVIERIKTFGVKQLIVRERALINHHTKQVIALNNNIKKDVIVEVTTLGTVNDWGLTKEEQEYVSGTRENISASTQSKRVASFSKLYQFANLGYKVIQANERLRLDNPHESDWTDRANHEPMSFHITSNAYILKYEPDSLYANIERDDSGAPVISRRLCEVCECPSLTRKENLIGIQASMNTEVIRNGIQVMEMMFPRIIALAERAWSKGSFENIHRPEMNNVTDAMVFEANRQYGHLWQREYNTFANNLRIKEIERLDKDRTEYYIGKAGCVIGNGFLQRPFEFPVMCRANTDGVLFQYRQGQSTQWKDFTTLFASFPFNREQYHFRLTSTDKKRAGPSITIRADWSYLFPPIIPLDIDVLLNSGQLTDTAGLDMVPQTKPLDDNMIKRLRTLTSEQQQALKSYLQSKRQMLIDQEKTVRNEDQKWKEHNSNFGALDDVEHAELRRLESIPASMRSVEQNQTLLKLAKKHTIYLERQHLLMQQQTSPKPLTDRQRKNYQKLTNQLNNTLSAEEKSEKYFLQNMLDIYHMSIRHHFNRLGDLNREEVAHRNNIRQIPKQQRSQEQQQHLEYFRQRQQNFDRRKQSLERQSINPSHLNSTEQYRFLYYQLTMPLSVNMSDTEDAFEFYYLQEKARLYDNSLLLKLGGLTEMELLRLEQLQTKHPLNRTEMGELDLLHRKGRRFEQRKNKIHSLEQSALPPGLSLEEQRSLVALRVRWGSQLGRKQITTESDWNEYYYMNMLKEINYIYWEKRRRLGELTDREKEELNHLRQIRSSGSQRKRLEEKDRNFSQRHNRIRSAESNPQPWMPENARYLQSLIQRFNIYNTPPSADDWKNYSEIIATLAIHNLSRN